MDTELKTMLVAVTPASQDESTEQMAISLASSEVQPLANVVANLARTTSAFEAFARRRFKKDDYVFAVSRRTPTLTSTDLVKTGWLCQACPLRLLLFAPMPIRRCTILMFFLDSFSLPVWMQIQFPG
jgi:hypothetical protein